MNSSLNHVHVRAELGRCEALDIQLRRHSSCCVPHLLVLHDVRQHDAQLPQLIINAERRLHHLRQQTIKTSLIDPDDAHMWPDPMGSNAEYVCTGDVTRRLKYALHKRRHV